MVAVNVTGVINLSTNHLKLSNVVHAKWWKQSVETERYATVEVSQDLNIHLIVITVG